MTDWVSKAGKAKIAAKAEAIVAAIDEALWNDSSFDSEYKAASATLREAINQCQNGQGMISAAELLLITAELEGR